MGWRSARGELASRSCSHFGQGLCFPKPALPALVPLNETTPFLSPPLYSKLENSPAQSGSGRGRPRAGPGLGPRPPRPQKDALCGQCGPGGPGGPQSAQGGEKARGPKGWVALPEEGERDVLSGRAVAAGHAGRAGHGQCALLGRRVTSRPAASAPAEHAVLIGRRDNAGRQHDLRGILQIMSDSRPSPWPTLKASTPDRAGPGCCPRHSEWSGGALLP